MRQLRQLSAYILLLLSALTLRGQAADSIASAPLMELQVNKFVLYPDRMGMTGTESLMECLQSIPALVQKGSVDIVDNYVIEENDNTYLHDPTIYLEQTRISEVDHIEITVDGTVSSGLSGVMGVINVVLKTPDSGTHVSADMLGNTNGEFYPTVYLSRSKGNFTAMGSVMALFDRTKSDVDAYSQSQLSQHTHFYTRHRDEAIKASFNWKLPKDEFAVKLSQYIGKDKAKNDYTTYSPADITQTLSNGELLERKLSASFDYSHRFSESTILRASVGVESITKDNETSTFYTPVVDLDLDDISSLDDSYTTTTTWSANLKLEKSFGSAVSVKIAIPSSWKSVDSKLYQLQRINDVDETLNKQTIVSRVNNYNPFVLVDINPHPQWTVNLGVREVIAHYEMTHTSYDDWAKTKCAAIYTSTVQYRPHQRHTLLANFRHTVGMPTVAQLYPNRWFYQSPNVFYTGDPDILPSSYDIWNVSYAMNLPRLQLSSSVQYYINRNDISTTDSYIVDNAIDRFSANADRANMLDANISAVWICGKLQLMGGASLYHKKDLYHYSSTWCCLRIVPTLQLPQQISLSAQLSYVSPQTSETIRTNESWYGLVRIAKRWGCGLSTFVYWENFLEHNTVTTTRGATPIVRTVTAPHENKLSIGLSYTFL
jgi:hypothetical protein